MSIINILKNKILYGITHNLKYIIVPYTKLSYNIINIIHQENYIKNFVVINLNTEFNNKFLVIEFLYINGNSKLNFIKFYNNRQYYNYKRLKYLYKINKFSDLF